LPIDVKKLFIFLNKEKKHSFDAVVTGNVNVIDNICIVSGNANGRFKTILNINSNLN